MICLYWFYNACVNFLPAFAGEIFIAGINMQPVFVPVPFPGKCRMHIAIKINESWERCYTSKKLFSYGNFFTNNSIALKNCYCIDLL